MCNSFLDFWNGERVDAIGSNRGKLDTYFYIKTHFGKEKYLQINNFKIRQSICKIDNDRGINPCRHGSLTGDREKG
jgi:hypothetical protein